MPDKDRDDLWGCILWGILLLVVCPGLVVAFGWLLAWGWRAGGGCA